MSSGSYSSGYSSGYSDGKAAGKREAFAIVDKAEASCLAALIAVKPAFQMAVTAAQKHLTDAYDVADLETYVDDDKVDVAFRSWKTLWLSKKHASTQDEQTVEKDAKQLLHRHFLAAAGTFSDDDFSAIALFAMQDKDTRTALDMDFERGHAAEIAVRLKDVDYYIAGFMARLREVAEKIRSLDAGDIIAADKQARNDRIENYQNFLKKALEQTAAQVADHIEKNAKQAAQSSTRGRYL